MGASLFLAATVALRVAAATPVTPASLSSLDDYAFTYTHAGSQLKDHIYARSRLHYARGDAARDALKTPAEVRERQTALRRFIAECVGGLPPSDTPLNPRVTGIVSGQGFTIEKILFEARPRHYVTANLYLPGNLTGRTGAVLFLSGHWTAAKQADEYQAVCQTLVQAGLVVLSQDPIGQGERFSYYEPEAGRAVVRDGTTDHDYAGAQCRFVGDSLGRYFLHDAMRGIDYLLTRPEVDPARIGVTGNSGGGTQTSLVMLADPRIAAAAPGTFIMTRDSYQRTGQAQDAEQIWAGFTRAGFDHEDILLAVAPKPVAVLAVTSDFFPIEGTRHAAARARRIWNLFGRGDALELVEDDSTHSYTPALAHAAARFFSRHLLQREFDATAVRTAPFPLEQLNVTSSGQVRGELPGAEFVFEANAALAAVAAADRGRSTDADRKTRARVWLRERVFFDREPCDLNPRHIARALPVAGFEVDVAFWWTQPHLANLGMLLRPAGRAGPLPVTVALWDNGTRALSRHAAWLRDQAAAGRAVFVLDVAGLGQMKSDPIRRPREGDFYDTMHKLSDDLDWLGDSLVALRTYDVLRALDVLATWPGLSAQEIRIYGHGRAGVHGRLAAALDARIAACEWREGFRFADFVERRLYDSTEIKSYVLPGVLRFFDLDEL